MKVRTGRRAGVSDPGSDREVADRGSDPGLGSRALLFGQRSVRDDVTRVSGAMMIAMGAFLLVGRLAG